ncbi:MAG TPA: carbon storage regulator [Clostridiales bacterium]|nr:MAG: carbon storage regulator [Clostridiales bacterium GWD2_32_19]HCC06926.1 carbon storage regulator [Clostridiales bacterium]
MLALSRKKGESIMIGQDIEITIVDIQADQVKIAISAPRSVQVHRKEIFLQIQQENKAANTISDKSIEKLKELK